MKLYFDEKHDMKSECIVFSPIQSFFSLFCALVNSSGKSHDLDKF